MTAEGPDSTGRRGWYAETVRGRPYHVQLFCGRMPDLCGNEKRIHILEELRRMTVMLSAEIGYANTMLDEAFGSIAKRVSQPLSDFLVHVQEKMQKGEEANLGVIFEKQLEMDLKGTALKESDLASLRTLGGQLGYLDVAMQKKTLDITWNRSVMRVFRQKKNTGRKKKWFRCLGLVPVRFLSFYFTDRERRWR